MKSFKVKCLHAYIGHIYLLYVSPMKQFNLLVTRMSQQKEVDNFQRNAQGSHLVFQNEANFSCLQGSLPPNKDTLQSW